MIKRNVRIIILQVISLLAVLCSVSAQQTDSVPPLIIQIPLVDSSVTFHWHSPEYQKLMFVVIHDDESTSSEVGYRTMHGFGASLLEMKNDGLYLCTLFVDSIRYIFNPNRIFSLNGIENSLMHYGQCSPDVVSAIALFAGQVTGAFFLYPEYIVALHNNRDKGFSVESYIADSVLRVSVDSIFINPDEDPDDFYFVNDPVHFSFIKEYGFNVVLQSSGILEDDGSLSVWCSHHNMPYINIETELGKYEKQLQMLEMIRSLLPGF